MPCGLDEAPCWSGKGSDRRRTLCVMRDEWEKGPAHAGELVSMNIATVSGNALRGLVGGMMEEGHRMS